MQNVDIEKEELQAWKTELEYEKAQLEHTLKSKQEEIERLRVRYKLSETVSWDLVSRSPKIAERLGHLSTKYFDEMQAKQSEFEETSKEIRAKIYEINALLETINRWISN